MSKMDRKKNRKARKQRFEALAGVGLPRVEEGQKAHPRDRRGTGVAIDPDPHPPRVVLEARARMAGVDIDAARAQSMGGPEGIAINIAYRGAKDGEDTANRLWRVYADWDRAEATYCRRILGRDRHAKTAKLEMMPDRMEARPDDRPDLRSDEERDRDATTNWMRWRGYIGHLDPHERLALRNANENLVELHSEQALTAPGRAFVAALERLAKVVEGMAGQ